MWNLAFSRVCNELIRGISLVSRSKGASASSVGPMDSDPMSGKSSKSRSGSCDIRVLNTFFLMIKRFAFPKEMVVAFSFL